MVKSLFLWLSRMMPLMMAAFLVLAVIQLGMMLHVMPWSFFHALYRLADQGRPFYLPVGTACLCLSIAGLVHYLSAERLARHGLRQRNTLLTRFLGRLTNSTMREKTLARLQREHTLNSTELAAALSARVIGQDQVCEDIAHQLRRRLALRKRTRPIGVFLFIGPSGTGKTLLARQLALQTERPFLQFDMARAGGHGLPVAEHSIEEEHLFLTRLADGLRKQPDALILLNNVENTPSELCKTLIASWNEGYLLSPSGRAVPVSQSIFILSSNQHGPALRQIAHAPTHTADETRLQAMTTLRQTGFPPELLDRLDRLFLFHPLKEDSLTRIAALETEKLIRDYGLTIEAGGADPALFRDIVRQQHRPEGMTNAHTLLRAIEDRLSDSLITAQQQKHTHVRIFADDTGHLGIQTSDAPQDRMNKASL